ncbi:ketopantoate reductase family protein [Lutibaculum baratangense]|uniref:Ketopantoate reductase N-terminal domain-containing protein n=1 Tax=Lutibaculum baratangense AMV1 TaxID=631454 RepID=V4RJY5_9HYPH|nr:2-dehydropantoate 2-reductase N-terminal domain-containing protein [Lutibaculum baratangense]ESR23565.1 hypothetical protein N177_3633 [Lutibaculum baratangense AMV1]
MAFNTLILGANYGSLVATKLLVAGHDVTLVCRPEEAELINAEGTRVRLPVKGESEPVVLDSRDLKGRLAAVTPEQADSSGFDLVVLGMQEPQYRAPEVKDLMHRIGRARTPAMSIMNMPPLTYMKRVPGIDADELSACYADAGVWDTFEPANMTLCSPDPQAIRPPDEQPNVVQVTLPTNFKAAPFEGEAATSILRQMQSDIEAVRHDVGGRTLELPVKLKVHYSIFVPFAKWPMLLTGNYRCVTPGGVQSVKDVVHGDPEGARAVYDWVGEVCLSLGASASDLVPFEKYAAAAQGLVRPSSAAKAVYSGAPYIERVDRLVQIVARQKGMRLAQVDEMVDRIDALLQENRRKSAA